MKLRLCAVLLFVSNLAIAGTGVRNGGSYYRCETESGEQIVMIEHLIASRGALAPRIEDRTEFFNFVSAKITDDRFRALLREQWEQYGDADTWPAGTLDEVTVYSYRISRSPISYGTIGKVPPTNPEDPICSFPAYEPEFCCEKVLASYFGVDDAKPIVLPEHFRRLDRYQKNILELHEAVYRVASKIGKFTPPPLEFRDDLDRYLASPWQTGELPADIVEVLIIPMLTAFEDDGGDSFNFGFHRYWAWSHAIYGSPKAPSKNWRHFR